jgi:hypothetical protein
MKSSLLSKALFFVVFIIILLPVCYAGELIKFGTYVDFTGATISYRVENITKVRIRKTGSRQVVPKLIIENSGFSLLYPFIFEKYTFDDDGALLSHKKYGDLGGDNVNIGPDGSFNTLFFQNNRRDYETEIGKISFYSSAGDFIKTITKKLGRSESYKYTCDGKYVSYRFIPSDGTASLNVYKTLDGSQVKKFLDASYCDAWSCDGVKRYCGVYRYNNMGYFSVFDTNWNLVKEFMIDFEHSNEYYPASNDDVSGYLIIRDGVICWSKTQGQVGWKRWPSPILGEMNADVYKSNVVINDPYNIFRIADGKIKTLKKFKQYEKRIMGMGNWDDNMAVFYWSNNTSSCYLSLLGMGGKETVLLSTDLNLLDGVPSTISCKGKFLVVSAGDSDIVYKISSLIKKE